MSLQPYREFRPTPFDSAGAFLHDDDEEGRRDWLIAPCSQNRDSDSLVRSNYRVQLAAIEAVDPDGADHEEHRFGHWGPGWFELVLVRPGSYAARAAHEIEARLDDYPILDDDDHSALEWEEVSEYWARESVASRLEWIQRANRNVAERWRISGFAARHAELPADDAGRLFELLARN
jgi:hypothetical protein